MTIQNARKSAFWASMVAVCLAAATAVGAERTLSADGKTLTFDIPADSVYTNTVTIESTVTNIVKVGGGEACFVPQTNNVYQGGIQIKGVGDTVVTDIQKGDWTMLKGVDFKDGCKTFSARASSKNGAVIKVCKANSSGGIGDAFAYIEVPAGGTMTDIAPVACNSIEGVNDIYFVFSGELEFDSWSFK